MKRLISMSKPIAITLFAALLSLGASLVAAPSPAQRRERQMQGEARLPEHVVLQDLRCLGQGRARHVRRSLQAISL